MSQMDIGTTVSGYDFSANPSPMAPGFEYGGSPYAFLCGGGGGTPPGDHKLHAFKNLDLGGSELDSANAPDIGDVTGFGNSYCICLDGDTVYVLYVRTHHVTGQPSNVQSTFVDGITVVLFDLLTGLWGASTDYSAPVVDFCQKDVLVANGFSRQVQVNLILRGSGDMIFYYSGPVEADTGKTGWARTFYATFDGSAFGTAVELPDQAGTTSYYFPNGGICDSHGITRFLALQGPAPGSTSVQLGNTILQTAMDSGGSFGTPEAASTALYFLNQLGSFSAPIVFTDSGVETIAFAAQINDNTGSTTQSLRVIYAQTISNTGALTWNNTIISQGVDGDNTPRLLLLQAFYLIATAITLSYQSGILAATWAWVDSDTSLGFFYFASTPFASLAWGAPAIVISTSINFYYAYQVSSFPVSAGIGVVGVSVYPFNDSEVAQYNVIPIGGSIAANRYRAWIM